MANYIKCVFGRQVLALCLLCLVGSPFAQEAEVYKRIEKLEKRLSTAGLIDLVEQLEMLQGELQFHRGQIEQLQHEIEKLQAHGPRSLTAASSLKTEVRDDARIPDQTSSVAPKSEADSVVDDGADNKTLLDQTPLTKNLPLGTQPDTSSKASLDGEASYREAFGLLKEGRYQEAIEGFKYYLSSNSTGKYADNSQYWLGEAYYVLQKYKIAIEQYSSLIRNFPDSKKSSHALLKIGYCYEKLRDNQKAIEVLLDLGKRFPNSAAARLATAKIEKLRAD